MADLAPEQRELITTFRGFYGLAPGDNRWAQIAWFRENGRRVFRASHAIELIQRGLFVGHAHGEPNPPIANLGGEKVAQTWFYELSAAGLELRNELRRAVE